METGSINTSASKNTRSALCLALFSIIHFSASAQEKTVQADTSSLFSNAMFLALLGIIVMLLIVIVVLADVVKAATHQRSEQEKKKNNMKTIIKSLLIFFALGGFTNSLYAQEATPVTVSADISYWGIDGFTFYLMLTIIAFEVFVAWMLYNISMQIIGVEERRLKLAEKKERVKDAVKQPSIIEKLNDSVAIEKEEDILLDHNYDGIRELDNNLPPWWKYGFYITIVWAVIYMVHYHVTNTGKLQQAEYEDQLTQAKVEMEEYRKKSANLVDENNATMLTDASSLSSGKNIYMDNCAACHGRAGEGGVGPNLIDDYWFHSGGLKDIFKTIKFGYPEKGMKAWQQDLSAKQIHEVASFIKSLYGTNPPNPKEKQGELYKDADVSDSTKVIPADTTQIVLKEK